MIRVYHFILDHRVGGPHVYVDTLRQALKNKVDSVIVTTRRGPMTDIALLNLRHLWTPLYTLEIIANTLFLLYLVLSGRIKRKQVIFNVHGSANIAPLAAARITGIPVVWHFHETMPCFINLVNIGKWLLNRHPHRLVVVAAKAVETYGLEEADLLPPTVDTAFWSRDEVTRETMEACGWKHSTEGGWKHSTEGGRRTLRALSVGNLYPSKGMDILLDAFAEIDGPWHLKIVGAELETQKEYAAKLYGRMREIVSLNKGSVIEFLGWQDKTEVRALLASCDLFVLPSRSEACPIILLEAMAMDCDCVAANVGDVSRMMKNYLHGRVFTAESVDDMRSSIKQFQADFRILNTMSEPTNGTWQLNELSAKTMQIYNSFI